MKRELSVVALFVALSIAMTWPLATHLSTAAGDDPLWTSWMLDWDHYATLHTRSLFDANIFYPAKSMMALSEHQYALALLTFPLYLAGVAPLTIHNIAILAGFIATGYAAYLLGRWITRSTAAGILAGIALTFTGMRFHHIGHLQYAWLAWSPLIILACLLMVRVPSWRNTSFLAAALTLNALTAMHYFIFGTTLAAITVVALGVRARCTVTYSIRAAIAFALMLVLNAPFLILYLRMPILHRDFAEVLSNSARWGDWFLPNLQSRLYGRFTSGDGYGHERTLFPGFIALALALFGVIADPWIVAALLAIAVALVTGWQVAAVTLIAGAFIIVRALRVRWANPLASDGALAAFLWLALGAWGARGVAGDFHRFLYEHAVGFNGIRMPARWALLADAGLAVFVALGAKRLLDRSKDRLKPALTLLLAAAMLFELRAAPIDYQLIPQESRPVYAWLAGLKLQGGVMELPMEQWDAYRYMWHSTEHHQPLLNGVSSYAPAHYMPLQDAYNKTPIDPSFIDQLEGLHCSLVIVHGDEIAFRGDAVRAWLHENLASGRLTFVRRFEGRIRGDYVFAIARNEHLPAAEFHDIGFGYNAEPFQHTEEGPTFEVIRGKLVVRGWAFAPAGIAAVNLRFGDGSAVVRADREPRDDIRKLLPWYPNDPTPGFTKTFDGPPPGIRGDTDMQVEIIDRKGKCVRGVPFLFRWYPAQPRIAWNEDAATELLHRLGKDAPADRERLFSGSAAIEDFTSALATSREAETDIAFTRRILTTILGRVDPPMESALLAKLTNGVSRERVIGSVLRSKAFSAKYYGVFGTKT